MLFASASIAKAGATFLPNTDDSTATDRRRLDDPYPADLCVDSVCKYIPAIPGLAPESNEDGSSEVERGCIFWRDARGTQWCKDVLGIFGKAGAVSYLDGDDWFPPESAEDTGDDGCIYWIDHEGIRWCRDVLGSYGPAGLQYSSADGHLWFGDGDAWIQLADEAVEYFAASALRRMQLSTKGTAHARTHQITPSGSSASVRSWTNSKGVLRMEGTRGKREDKECDHQESDPADGLYGQWAGDVRAMEARMDAAFDDRCKAVAPAMWPELPLRL